MNAIACFLCCALMLVGEEAVKKTRSETLHFNVNWPSGLSLGEGEMVSSFDGTNWALSMNVEASIPAYKVAESAKAKASADLCSTELTRTAKRGQRSADETTTFDASALTATRESRNGGKSEIRIGACARDALTFIQHLRRELAAGRLPQPQVVYFGAGYRTRVQYSGTVQFAGTEADKLTAFVKGPASDFAVELYFARDAVRTPLQAVIPVTIGKFTVEFSR
ncbi:MAG TPA: DUF3108 domain-containing protein [Bryobacteraceae bacterium]|nr:DUF3108 domain-containing protein [Bryobacteraceae bacterium]